MPVIQRELDQAIHAALGCVAAELRGSGAAWQRSGAAAERSGSGGTRQRRDAAAEGRGGGVTRRRGDAAAG
jgi:hypothetical protein